MKSKSEFYLSKWYFDLVDNYGNVFIGYHANFIWKSISFHYASSLFHSKSKTISQVTWRKQPLPFTDKKLIRWNSPRLDVEAEWITKSEPINKNLLSIDDKNIQWNCICPKGKGCVNIGKEKLVGLGYVEHLEMSIKPWKLPFDELRWGRFISANNYLVWIDWQGNQPNNWVFKNNEQIFNCEVTDERISLPNNLLQLDKISVLREGSLLSTSFNRSQKKFSIFPKHFFNSYECKWLSKGVLTDINKSDKGWSIHEVVKWK